MGASTAQVQSSTQPQGKGGYSSRPGSALASVAANAPTSSDPNSLMQAKLSQAAASQGWSGVAQRNDMSTMPQFNDMRGMMQAIQQPEQGQEYGAAVQPQRQMQPQGKGGAITTPVQSGQPSIGRPNTYANTVGPWDNSTNSTQMPFRGKGKGA